LIGRVLQHEKDEGGEHWDYVHLPAVAEDNDLLGRARGEALWPEKFPRPDLDRIKKAVGSRVWASLYQQRPTEEAGGMFKREWFRYYREKADCYELLAPDLMRVERRVMKRDCWRFGASDLALTTKTYNDYSAIGVGDVESKAMGSGSCNLFVLDMWRDRMEAPYVEDRMRATIVKWNLGFIGVEDNNNFDTSVIQRFKRDNIPVRAIKPDRDKVTRATTASVWQENGHIWLPVNAPWLLDFENELLVFPNGAHDDQVDVLAYMTIFANDRDLWQRKAEEKTV
jgi:predicted phage terminase large subunit-like protein